MCVRELEPGSHGEVFRKQNLVLLRLSPAVHDGDGGGGLMFQGSGQDLRNKILFLGILVSPKRRDLLLNRADLLPATLPLPPVGQSQVPDQDTGRGGGAKPGNHSSAAGRLVLLKMRFENALDQLL